MKTTLLTLAAIGLLVLIVCGGCTYQVREPVEDAAPAAVYSRGEVDAINAETQCRAMARNLVQAQRCGVRR